MNMELNTYTALWNVERKLFKIYDWTLPFPLGFRQLGVGGGFGLAWIFMLSKFGVPFAAPWHVFYLGPPAILGWLAGKPVAEGKTLIGLVHSQFRYWVGQPHTLTRLAPERSPKNAWVNASVWHDTYTTTLGRPGLTARAAENKTKPSTRARHGRTSLRARLHGSATAR